MNNFYAAKKTTEQLERQCTECEKNQIISVQYPEYTKNFTESKMQIAQSKNMQRISTEYVYIYMYISQELANQNYFTPTRIAIREKITSVFENIQKLIDGGIVNGAATLEKSRSPQMTKKYHPEVCH